MANDHYLKDTELQGDYLNWLCGGGNKEVIEEYKELENSLRLFNPDLKKYYIPEEK